MTSTAEIPTRENRSSRRRTCLKATLSTTDRVSNIRKLIDQIKFAAYTSDFLVYHILSYSFGSIFIIVYILLYVLYVFV